MSKSICLFDFSKIKSKQQFKISEYNFIKYNFDEFTSQKSEKNSKNNEKKDKQQYYIKKVNMNIPSNELLKDENFRNEFFHNYDTSFSKFCGINKKIYKEIYKQIQYIPELNKMGNIQIDIDNIIKITKKFSSNRIIKFHRRPKNKKISIKNPKNEFGSLISKKRKKISSITKIKAKNIENSNDFGENNITEKKDELAKKDLFKKNEDKNKINISYKNNNIKSESKDIHIAATKKTLFDIKKSISLIKIKNNSKKDAIFTSEKNKENHNILSNDEKNIESLETKKYIDNYKTEEEFFLINNEQIDNNILNLMSEFGDYYLPNNLLLSNDEDNKSPKIDLFNSKESKNTFIDNLSNGFVQSTNNIRIDNNNVFNI